MNVSYLLQDDIYGEARSLYNEILGAGDQPSAVVDDITKRFVMTCPFVMCYVM